MAWQDELWGTGKSAQSAMIDLFRQFGLGSLASKITKYVKLGFESDTIYLLLQDTPEWKQRFIGNEYRQKAGLSVLSPQEYIATERGYMQAIQSMGLPASYYDQPKDFVRWMERDVSPDEVLERAKAAREVVDTIDPEQKRALAQYGIRANDLVAYYLDPKRALPILQKQVDVARLDAERKRAGYSYSRDRAERLYDRGVTVEQAREGYSAIAQTLPTLEGLAEIDNVEYGLAQAEMEVFDQDADAAETRRRLISNEVGRFSGSSGQSGTTLAGDNTFN